MLQHNIDTMRDTVSRMLARKKPPRQVGILVEHADYLGIAYTKITSVKPEATFKSMPIVFVRLGALVDGLKGAVGSEYSIKTRNENDTGAVEHRGCAEGQS